MKVLRIGQAVSFDHIARLEYYEDNTRAVVYQRIVPLKGCIAGQQVKYAGTYNKGYAYGSWSGLEPADPEPPWFSPSKAVRLWVVQIGWRNRPLLVGDQHITPLDVDYELPGVTSRPIHIIEEEHEQLVR